MLRRGCLACSLAGGLAGVLLAAGPLLPSAAAAEMSAEAARRLQAVLQAGQVETLKLAWTMGREEAGSESLRIDGGRATLLRCEPSPELPANSPANPSPNLAPNLAPAAATHERCRALGVPLGLTAGQREQLMSALRSADLPHLRSADADVRAAADRRLELEGAAAPLGRWQLSRSEWPTPPDGYGLAEFFDELAHKLRQGATARPPVSIPTTVAELAALRVQLRLTPRTRPGGLVTIEHGLVHVTPAEGSLPRSPPPRPWERPLDKSEEEQLVRALQAAQLEQLDQQVPKRGAPAIGDEDGRLATLHLLRADPAAAPSGRKPASSVSDADPVRVEPRGIERYLADLMRSPARPLCQQLIELLLAEPPAAAARGAGAKRASGASGASGRRSP